MPTRGDSSAAQALAAAIAPLLERVGGQVVPVTEQAPDDVVLTWEGRPTLAVRLEAASGASESSGLDYLLQSVASELGGPLDQLSRPLKQRAVRILDERGAFTYRKSAEVVAEALGVSRFTVYNYLNRNRTG